MLRTKLLSTMLAHPGWWAVFTSLKGEPDHMPIAAWASIEYSNDEDDEGHMPGCPERYGSFTAVEAMIADGVELVTIREHSCIYMNEEYLLGIFGPGEYEKVTPEEWNGRCRERLQWIQERVAIAKAQQEKESGPKTPLDSMN